MMGWECPKCHKCYAPDVKSCDAHMAITHKIWCATCGSFCLSPNNHPTTPWLGGGFIFGDRTTTHIMLTGDTSASNGLTLNNVVVR